MTEFTLNGRSVSTDADPDTPLLWVLRERFEMTGTKFGCGVASCGACTVHLDGQPIRACVTPLASIEGTEITTIEGITEEGEHPVQTAWIEMDVPQCGYCQSGQIMTTIAMLRDVPDPTDDDIDTYLSGNLCRCGVYPRIRAAVKRAAELSRG